MSDPPKKTSKESKEALENKIKQLEGKLGQLSDQLGKKPETQLTPSMLKKNPIDKDKLRSEILSSESIYKVSELENYERNYLKRLKEIEKEKDTIIFIDKSKGTLPKGFGGEINSPYILIMSYDKKYAKDLFKSKRCLGCKKHLDKQHVILCHECATERLTESEFNGVIRKFTDWGFYKKPFLTGIAIKLRLAKVITDEKHEKK